MIKLWLKTADMTIMAQLWLVLCLTASWPLTTRLSYGEPCNGWKSFVHFRTDSLAVVKRHDSWARRPATGCQRHDPVRTMGETWHQLFSWWRPNPDENSWWSRSARTDRTGSTMGITGPLMAPGGLHHGDAYPGERPFLTNGFEQNMIWWVVLSMV